MVAGARMQQKERKRSPFSNAYAIKQSSVPTHPSINLYTNIIHVIDIDRREGGNKQNLRVLV